MKRVNSKRQSNVSKSRLLARDLGKDRDNLYYPVSGQIIPGYQTQDYWQATAKQWYNTGRLARTTNLVVPDLIGAESINSTRGRHGSMNNCTHIKQRYVCYPVTRAAEQYNRPSRYTYEMYWRRASSMSYWKDAANTALAVALMPDLMFSARAYWSMRPKFQSDISLINSVFELKDFSDVANVMFGKDKAANSRVRRIAKQAKGFNTGFNKSPVLTGLSLASKGTKAIVNALSRPAATVAHFTKWAAQAQLTYALAIMPTVRDVMSIHATAQQDVYALAKSFQQFGDEGARSHYSEHEVIEQSCSPGTYNNYVWGDGKYIKRTLSATMYSYYRVLWERLENRYPKWWGLEIGADEVWNMLPMSFVMDYVWTIGKSLEYMDRDETVDILSTEYCESCKVVASSGLFYLQDTRTPALMIDGVYQMPRSKLTPLLVTGTAGSYYQRVVKEPYKGPALPKFKAPSSSQTANLIALARCLLF